MMDKQTTTAFFIITTIYLLLILIVSPVGEFPINDDWAYARSVKNFLETGNIKISDGVIANLLFQVLWGILFSKLLGFSFTTLRISTIVLSFLGTITMYLILKELKFSNKLCIFGALLLLFNPLYFHNTYTFMTDIPFISLFLLSSLFYIKGIKKDNNLYFLLGSVFAIFTFLIRQHGIILPIGTAIYLFLNREKHKLTKEKIFLLIIFPILSVIIFQYWYLFIHGQTIRNAHTTKMLFGSKFVLIRPFYHSFSNFVAFGLYLLPLTLIYSLEFIKKTINSKVYRYIALSAFVILSICFLTLWLISDGRIYVLRAILNSYLSRSVVSIAIYSNPEIMLVMSILAILSTTFIIVLIYSELQVRVKETSPINFFYFIAIIYLITLAITPSWHDRYILPSLPAVLVLMLISIKKFPFLYHRLAIVLIIFSFFSIVGTYDFLNFNRVKWSILNNLMDSGISPKNIDGGAEGNEFNCWFLYEYCLEKFGHIDPIWPGNKSVSQKLCVVNNDYVLSLSELPEYFVLDKVKYTSLIGGDNFIYVLKKRIY